MHSLAKPVQAYFDANRRFDLDTMLATFCENATVIDEKHTYRTHAAIRAWIKDATISAQALATPMRASPPGGHRQTVTADVSGPFSGSPITLTFHFDIQDDLITGLEIG